MTHVLTPTNTYAPWLAHFRLECARAALTLEQSRDLEERVQQVIDSDVLPMAVQTALSQAPLLELPWLASAFGIERAAQSFEVTALTALLSGQALSLERDGVLPPGVRASLDYCLAQMLPDASANAVGATRERLRAMLGSSQSVGTVTA